MKINLPACFTGKINEGLGTEGAVIAAAILFFSCQVNVWSKAENIKAPPSPAPQTDLQPMLRIDWSTGPDLPQGFQDSDGGVLGNALITVGGFCSGGLDLDNRMKPGRYPRGFLNNGWKIDLEAVGKGWISIPDFPGVPRQGLSSAVVNGKMYFWGGFSYSEPYCYSDGWRLSKDGGQWLWEALPDFPWPITTVAMTVIGSRIYAVGGADYNGEAFFTETDRTGEIERLGSRLLVFDTEEREAEWKPLPPCPGTPRWVHAAAAIDGKIYVIGGATGNIVRGESSFGYCTVVDNWAYDAESGEWSRMRDLPISSGNFPRGSNLVYKGRYILLPGGHQYTYVCDPDGEIREKYGTASTANPGSSLHNDVFVYDARSDLFGRADELPIDNNLPMTVVQDDKIFLLGGETGGGMVLGEYYGHHPDLFLVGKIEEIDGRE